MANHQLEVADIFRSYKQEYDNKYGHSLSREQRKAMRAIIACRTSELGGHRFCCDQCGHERIAYNSCRNRHCPKCQATARAAWLESRAADLLPVPYFHVVFTLPNEFGSLALQNPRVVYGILFRAAWETLRDVAADPKHLGAKIGMLAVLHTWGQNLMHHPHVHCVVPGGGLSPCKTKWINCKQSRRSNKHFFLPVRVLSRVFRGKFIALLKKAKQRGELKFHGQIRSLEKADVFEYLVDKSVTKEWVVYCKRPFGSPKQVLKYLARYTHRVAIANSRLVDIKDDRVRFRWKNYACNNESGIMSLTACEFIRRFLLHILPSGFVRIRHFGIFANRVRKENLKLCRDLLGVKELELRRTDEQELKDQNEESKDRKENSEQCEQCKKGVMRLVETFEPAWKQNFMTDHRQLPQRAPPNVKNGHINAN